MYRLLYDQRTLFDPYGDDDEVVSDASLSMESNASSYLDFTISAKHPLYDVVAEREGVVRLYSDDALLFEGIIESIETDLELNKVIGCISALEYLNDSVVRPYSTVAGEEDLTAPSSVAGYFQWLIDQHNEHVLDTSKQFKIGVNQGSALKDSDYVYYSSSSYPTTASELTTNVIDAYGGYLFLRYENGLKVLDLYADVHDMNAQVVDFGVNITDFTKTVDTKDQCTALVVQGGSPTFVNGDFEDRTNNWEVFPGTEAATGVVHSGTYSSYFTEGYGEYVNSSFFYLKSGWRYKSIAWVKNERSSDVVIRAFYQTENGGSWVNYSCGGTDSLTVPNDGEWHELTVDFLPNGSENAKIRPRWIFDYVSNDGGRVYVDDFDFTRIDGEDSVAEDPIDLTLIPDGVSNIDENVVKNGDAIYSTSYVARYGYKETTYSDDSLTTLDELMRQGVVQLRKIMAPTITLDVKAVDLALLMEGYEHLQVGQAVRVRSVPHDVDEYLMVSSIDLDLQNPGQTEYIFGASYDSLTGQQSGYLKSLNAGINASLDSVASLDQSVKDQAVQIGSVEQIANDAKDTADNAQNTANSAQQAAQDAQNSASSALDKAEAVEGAVSEIQGMIDDINSGAEQAKQDAAQAKADAQQAAAKADAASQAAQAAANKADALEGSITDVTTTVNGVVQDIEEITTSVTGAISTANEALSAASSASQDLEGFKTTVSQTYQLKGDYATNTDLDEAIAEEVLNRNSAIEQSASSITSTVSQTYATKTDLAVTDGKAAQAQSAAQQAQTSASNAQSTANAANNTANGVAEDLTDYMETVATTYASKSELEQTSESITATVESNYTEVKQLANTAQSTADSALSKANEASGELADFTESVTSDLSDLQSQIDGNIATWFYAGTPTLTNEPAVNWTTTEEKNQHLGDLYYDTNSGYAWRFMVQDGSYSWGRITDSDVAKALEDAANAQDTADSKRRVFVSQPTPPYDVGDLWVQGENGDILSCATARASGSYNASDWAIASKYTDDSALEIFEGQVADIYSTKAELETATDAITATVEENFEKSVLVKEADGGIIDCGDTAGMPLAGLTVYGQTRQNLWVNPSGTNAGVTVTNNDDGSVTFSGTATAATFFYRAAYVFKPSTQYTLSVDKALPSGVAVYIENANADAGYVGISGERKNVTFTTKAGLVDCIFGISVQSGSALSGTYRVMLNEGSEAEPWCPPGLNSVDELSIVTAGKNMWQDPAAGTNNGITYTNNGDGSWTLNGTASAWSGRYTGRNTVPVVPGAVLTLSALGTSGRMPYCYVEFTDAENVVLSGSLSLNTYDKSTGVVPDGAAYAKCCIGCNVGATLDNVTIYPQLEIGSTATAYEPPAVTSTPIDLLGNKVSSLPDGTRDELVVDAGGNVVLRKRAVELTAPSSESSWGDELENNRIYTPISQAADFAINESYLHAFCDKLPLRSSGFNRSRTETYLSSVYLYAQYGDAVDKSTMVSRISGGEYIYRSALRLIPLGTVDLPDLPETNAHVWVSTSTQGLDPDIHATWYGENASALKDFASKAELKVESDQIKATVEETYSTKEEVSAVEDKADAAQDALDSYKETVSTTYATKSSVTQTANSIKQEVSETYTTKTDASATYATKTSLSTVEQTVNGLKSTVSSNYTTLNNKFNNYYNKTEVDQKDNSIKSTVSSVQTTANNALEKATEVEQTADGLAVRVTQAEEDVDTAQSTADTAKTNAATAQSTANTANSTANAANTAAANAQSKADSAYSKATTLEVTVDGIEGRVQDAEGNISSLEQTSSGLEVRLTQAEKDVDTAQSTANTAKTNAATAQSTANAANSTANTAKTNAATAQNTANAAQNAAEAAQSTANTAKTAAATAQTTATNAAKTATNYLKFDSAGLCVGNQTGTLGYNTLIKSTGIDIRNGSTVLASFGASKLELGKNSSNSVIDFNNGLVQITSGSGPYTAQISSSENVALMKTDAQGFNTGSVAIRNEEKNDYAQIELLGRRIATVCYYGSNLPSVTSDYDTADVGLERLSRLLNTTGETCLTQNAAPLNTTAGNTWVGGSFTSPTRYHVLQSNDMAYQHSMYLYSSGNIVIPYRGIYIFSFKAYVYSVAAGDLCHFGLGSTNGPWDFSVDFQIRAHEDYDGISGTVIRAVEPNTIVRPWYKCEQGGGSSMDYIHLYISCLCVC